MTRVVLATHNQHKLVELRRLLADTLPGVELLGLDDVEAYPEPAETERTFEGNAILKAREAASRTGLTALADDSGIEVDVLNGMPGVRSARWSGPQATDESNRRLLLAQVDDVPDEQRCARFRCVMALVTPAGEVRTTSGAMEGRLATAEAGSNGFGYDPIFVAAGNDVTNGELSPQEKDRMSHRGKAVRAMLVVLAELDRAGRL